MLTVSWSWEIDSRISFILGVLGVVTALGMLLSPIATFSRVISNKSTEKFSPFPYVVTFTSCYLWVIYSLPCVTADRISPLVTNSIGSVLSLYYTIVYIVFADKHSRSHAIKLCIASLALILPATAVTFYLEPGSRTSFIGYFAAVSSVVMFGSPLSIILEVIKTQSVEFMPFYLSLGSFLCSSSWAVYGLYVQDLFVFFPNVLGALLGITQLVLYFIVSNSSQDPLVEPLLDESITIHILEH